MDQHRRSAPTIKGWLQILYVGLSADAVIVVQQGTVEEIGAALQAAGADDGIILDNGGSVACWVWWAKLVRGRDRFTDG
jgi:hypothetical protein